MQTATADPLVGRLLEGRYRIIDRIARGGMSTVYAAVDERLDRRVAVKVMSSGLSADPKFSDRFAREARAAARLAHVNAVAVYDQGLDTSAGENHVFLVMELVQGRTLRDLMRERQGRFAPADAISIMEPVLSALSAAHRAGLVHGDVKPENILLSDEGLVKVADFGLARAIDADAASTRTGLMMGTVAYCAPEQIVHGRSDQRSDVYSAGIVLFELLTGHTPFQGTSAMNVAFQHVHSRVPAPSSRVKGIPTAIDEIVVAATDSDPSGRPVDASAFLAEIADARTNLALPIVPIPPRRRPPLGGRRDARRHAAGSPSSSGSPGAADATSPVRWGAGGSGRAPAPYGRNDTEIVSQRPPTNGDAPLPPPIVIPPPPIVIPPPKRRQPRSRRARRRRRLVLLIVFILLGALSVGGGIAGVRKFQAWNLHVPNVAGSSMAVAEAKLQHTGYRINDSVTNVFSETVKNGVVISTEPAAGTRFAKGKTIRLVVSLGKDRVSVPDVAERSLTDAETLLQARGLQFDPSPITTHSITIQQGTVISTTPPVGSLVKRTDRIKFVVSSGPPSVAIPSVAAGTPFDAAKQALTKAHFNVTSDPEFSDTIADGLVVSVPSGRALYGSTISVTVSKGPEFVTIPDVTPLEPLADVLAQLDPLHLDVHIKKEFGGKAGRVINIDPASGTQVHPGDKVTVTVV